MQDGKGKNLGAGATETSFLPGTAPALSKAGVTESLRNARNLDARGQARVGRRIDCAADMIHLACKQPYRNCAAETVH